MENMFTEFNPIDLNPTPSKEEIAQYYTGTGVKTGTDFIDSYLGINNTPFTAPKPADKTSVAKPYDVQSILKKGARPVVSDANVNSPNPLIKSMSVNKVKNEITNEIDDMDVSDEDKDFLIKMAQAESSFKPYITNSLGYYGLYQFGNSALKTVGMTKEDFKDTKNQHKAALKLADLNEKTNKSLFDKYIGTKKDGVLVTRNGLRAASALLGAKGVREWLEGGNSTWTARHGHKDAYGTGPEKYLKLFV